MAYQVKTQFAHIKELTTVVNGKRVALNGAYTKTIEATQGGPAVTVSVPAAAPADLAMLFKEGNPCIEEVNDTKTAVAEKNG